MSDSGISIGPGPWGLIKRAALAYLEACGDGKEVAALVSEFGEWADVIERFQSTSSTSILEGWIVEVASGLAERFKLPLTSTRESLRTAREMLEFLS